MDLGLRGKKAIVTGSTRGIGRAIVEALAAEGAEIGLCARSDGEVGETLRSLQSRGIRAVGEAVDVKDGDAYKAWLVRTAEALGGCDIFVPNVSGGGGFQDDKFWYNNFEADVMHTVRGCETLMPWLEKSGTGSIVIITSTSALETTPTPKAYNAMKGALVVYGKQLSQYVAAKGVRVNCISPGPIYFKDGPWDKVKAANPAFFDSVVAQIPVGRMGSDQEVGSIVAFVASPVASLMTGAHIVADNGFTKRVHF